jgi:RNA-directed DNA polymerase
MGYKRLLSFELARLCTTLRLPKSKNHYIKHRSFFQSSGSFGMDGDTNRTLYPYRYESKIGILPQGAPTSPMLSNIVAIDLDKTLYSFAQTNGFIYSRYADDLTFSASILPKNISIGQIKREIISLIRKNGFIENKDKFRIAGPGSKKIVLGLLVDGVQPKISRELLKRIDRCLYSIEKFGIEKVADHDGFKSTFGFYNHISGLISFIKDVDIINWEKINQRFSKISCNFKNM